MSDPEVKDLVWRAFSLGARTAMDVYKGESTGLNRSEHLALLRTIASGEYTLIDPERRSAKPDQVLFDTGCQVIHADRQLAALVLEGLNQACNTAG